jgi:hypothetical protein
VDFDEFEAVLSGVRASSIITRSSPELQPFGFRRASGDEIALAESALGVSLPLEYRQFMTTYGGGQFLFLDLLLVAAADQRLEDIIGVNRAEAIPGFIAIAPVGTGDWWGFEVRDSGCDERVSFWYHDDGVVEAKYSGFLEFLVEVGLRASGGN